MGKSIAILHAPNQPPDVLAQLAARFRKVLKLLDADPGEMVCGSDSGDITRTLTVGDYETLIVGWGDLERPNWGEWFSCYLNIRQARHVLVFDLTDDDWPGGFPIRNARERRSGKANGLGNDKLFKRFSEGSFTGTQPPFGFQLSDDADPRVRLVAESEEASIVRLIFDLYVTSRHSRPAIAHLLNAQQVRPPRNNAKWTPFKVDSLLTDPVYIGASRYKNFLRQNSFEVLVDPIVFYTAQAMLLAEKRERAGVSAPTTRQPEPQSDDSEVSPNAQTE